MVQAGILIPDVVTWLGPASSFEFLPNSLLVFVPLAALIVIGLRRSGYGRLLFAVGDNPIAARLVRDARLAGPPRALRHLGGPVAASPGS